MAAKARTALGKARDGHTRGHPAAGGSGDAGKVRNPRCRAVAEDTSTRPASLSRSNILMGSMRIQGRDGRARQVGCVANAELAELWSRWIAEAAVLASSRQALETTKTCPIARRLSCRFMAAIDPYGVVGTACRDP